MKIAKAAAILKIPVGLLASMVLAIASPAENAVIRLISPDRSHELTGDRELTKPLAIKNLTNGDVEASFEVLSPYPLRPVVG